MLTIRAEKLNILDIQVENYQRIARVFNPGIGGHIFFKEGLMTFLSV